MHSMTICGLQENIRASQVVPVVKNLPVNARDIRGTNSIPESGRSPGVGNGNPLQYSCLENPMNKEALCEMQEFEIQRI